MKPENCEYLGVRICFLPRGSVVVCRLYRAGEYEYAENCCTIRRWGTDAGVGQLRNGPLPDTKLDYCGRDDWHILQRFRAIECDESKWRQVLDRVQP